MWARDYIPKATWRPENPTTILSWEHLGRTGARGCIFLFLSLFIGFIPFTLLDLHVRFDDKRQPQVSGTFPCT